MYLSYGISGDCVWVNIHVMCNIGKAYVLLKTTNIIVVNKELDCCREQQVLPNTKNEKLRGRTFFPKDKAVMDLMDPYLTTNNKTHRRFTHQELDSFPRKDIATYWDCEEYPKAWGFGSKHKYVVLYIFDF